MHATRRAALLAGALVALATAPFAHAAPRPDVVWSADTEIVTGTAAGAEVARMPYLDYPSLADGLVVGTRSRPGQNGFDRVVVRRAGTGALVRIFPNAFASAPLPGGARVVFSNDRFNKRVPSGAVGLYVGRVATGKVRRLTLIDAPKGGYQTGIEAATLISMAPAPDGRTVAITWGNDVDLFRSDVFLVRVKDGKVRRLTTAGLGSFPAWSPDATQVVHVRARGEHLTPGDLAGALVIRRVKGGTGSRVLAPATASVFYASPRWVGAGTIWALRMTWDGTTLGSGVVAIDVASGAITPLSAPGVNVQGFSRLPGPGDVRVEQRFDAGSGTASSVVLGPSSAAVALPGPFAEARGLRTWP